MLCVTLFLLFACALICFCVRFCHWFSVSELPLGEHTCHKFGCIRISVFFVWLLGVLFPLPLLWSIPGQCLVAQCHVCVDLCSICCQICFWDSFPLNIFVVCWLLFHVSKVNPCRCLLLMDFSHSVVSYPLERYTDSSIMQRQPTKIEQRNFEQAHT